MTISIVQSNIGSPTYYSNTTGQAFYALTGVTAGNAILVSTSLVDTNFNTTAISVSDGTGYAVDASQNYGNNSLAYSFSLLNVSAGSHNITASGAASNYGGYSGAIIVMEVSGLRTTGAFDKTAGAKGHSTGPVATGTTGSLSNANSLIVAVAASVPASGLTIPPTGGPGTYTSAISFTTSTNADIDYQIQTSGTSGVSASWGTASGSSLWACLVATYQASGGVSAKTQMLLGVG